MPIMKYFFGNNFEFEVIVTQPTHRVSVFQFHRRRGGAEKFHISSIINFSLIFHSSSCQCVGIAKRKIEYSQY